MKFYIKENNQWVEKSVLLSPEITTTFDETLDSATVILATTSNAEPYKPDTLCKFEIDNDTLLFIIAVDDVECVSRTSLLYQHHLSLVQNTRLLSKHIVRNSSFSQPARRFEKSWCFRTYWNVTSDDHRIRSATFSYKTRVVPKIRCKFKVYHTGDEDFEFTSFTNEFGYRTFDMSQEDLTQFTAIDHIRFKFNVTFYNGTSYEVFVTKEIGDYDEIGKEFEIDIPSIILNEGSPIKSMYIWPDFEGDWVILPLQSVLDAHNIGQQNWALHLFCEIDTYNFTMWDVIDILRKQQQQTTNTYSNNVLFEMPTDTNLVKLLKETIAPNFTFTGTTMFDALSEIFKFYDATFTIDDDNVLGIEYLNETTKNTINKNFSNVNISVNEDSYNKGLINTFENSYIEEETIVPVRNTQLGVPSDDNNYCFILPHDIHEIISAEILIPAGTWGGKSIKQQYVDITWYIMEQSLYSLLEKGSGYVRSSNTQENTLYFSDNNIYVGTTEQKWGFGGTYRRLNYIYNNISALLFDPHAYSSHSVTSITIPRFQDTKLRIKYLTRVNGRIRIDTQEERYKGEMIVNQSQGSVETQKLGLNMIGLSMKLGNPSLGMTQETSTWNNRIKKGDIYSYNGERWLANSVRYSLFNDYVKTTIDFVKNFNSLSTRVQVDREKRLSNISNELTVMAEENYVEYVYVGFNTEHPSYETTALTSIGATTLYYNILYTFGYETTINNEIEFACINSSYDTDESIKENIFIPMVKYAAGNTVCFEIAYDSAISAGNKTTYGTKIYTESVLYCDSSGWFDNVTINFCRYTNSSFGHNFPEVQSSELIHVGRINNYHFYKKPNEIFAFNYELQFLPYTDDILIGSKFIEKNGLLQRQKDINLKLYYGKTYDVLDTKGDGDYVNINSVTMNMSTTPGQSVLSVEFNVTNNISATGFAICDNDRNIYLASNRTINTNKIVFSFTCRHNKI